MAVQKVQIKASTRRTKSGKVVQIRAHDQNRDTVGENLKTEGRTPTASQPGNFPNGRSTPTTPGVAKHEAERQDEEIRAAQIRARMAEKQLEQLQEQQQPPELTPLQSVSMYSIADQFDAFMNAVQAGHEIPEDEESYDKLAPTLLAGVDSSTGKSKHKSRRESADEQDHKD